MGGTLFSHPLDPPHVVENAAVFPIGGSEVSAKHVEANTVFAIEIPCMYIISRSFYGKFDQSDVFCQHRSVIYRFFFLLLLVPFFNLVNQSSRWRITWANRSTNIQHTCRYWLLAVDHVKTHPNSFCGVVFKTGRPAHHDSSLSAT